MIESKKEKLGSQSNRRESHKARSRRILELLLRFFLGQGALQAIGVLSGLYLVRVLSVEAYAQFGLATSFQQLTALLMDLGFASTIVPLVGSRRDDRALVGRYIRSAKHLRDRVFFLLSPIAVVLFLFIMHRHHWSGTAQTVLIISVLVSLYATGKVSYFSTPLILQGKMKELYAPQAFLGLLRLLLLGGLRGLGLLNGWVAVMTGTLNTVLNGRVLEAQGRKHLDWPEQDDPATNREVVRYILPAVPAMIFAAFQLQSSVFLISIFGKTSGIAQVSALGRLNQIFSILMIFNAVIVEPFMARLEPGKVLSRYMLLLGLALGACTPFILVAFLAPDAVLWLLGSKYEGLRNVVGWAMLAGALNYLQVLLWTMNRARKWVFWRGTILEIGLTLVIEISFIVFHGVRTTPDAVYFSLVATLGPLATHIYVTVFGLSQRQPGVVAGSAL